MSFKETKRKGFNFFRSYFDVYNELKSDKDKVAFIDALLNRQFLGVRPENMKGLAKFAYISQTNSIDSQVKGYEDKMNIKLTPCLPPTVGGCVPPAIQVEEKEKEKEKGKGKGKVQLEEKVENPFSDSFINIWDQWKDYKKSQFNFTYKSAATEQAALTELLKASEGNEKNAIEIINQSIGNGWKGFFKIKQKSNGQQTTEDRQTDILRAVYKKFNPTG
jgi:hypothetical protein